MFNPHTKFPGFYENPAIRTLADSIRWTISGQIGDVDDGNNDIEDSETRNKKRKAPIDVRHLIKNNAVRGAWATDAQCLVTLDELTTAIPMAANNAYYLQSRIDGLMVIDIEKTCPPEIAAGILALPQKEILYSELSMSGRGYHLVAKLPPNFHDFPLAAGKAVLREKHGWYEILLEHWVTFTRMPITGTSLPEPDEEHIFTSTSELYESLARLAVESSTTSAQSVRTAREMPDIIGRDIIVTQTLAAARPRLKMLDDFDNDHSRWEFSVLGRLYTAMYAPLRTYSALHSLWYSPEDEAWLLFSAAQEVIPHRAKHNERRNGRPFLLDRAASLVAQRQEKQKQQYAENTQWLGTAF